MIDYESDTDERIDSRTERALTRYLTVLPETGRAKGADGLSLVVSQSGSEYLVDSREGRSRNVRREAIKKAGEDDDS